MCQEKNALKHKEHISKKQQQKQQDKAKKKLLFEAIEAAISFFTSFSFASNRFAMCMSV